MVKSNALRIRLRKVLENLPLTFSSIILCLVALEFILRISGVILLWHQHRGDDKGVNSKNVVKILAIGESTTQGWLDNTYPLQLEEMLNSRSPDSRFKVINEGVSGLTTYPIAEKLDSLLARHKPHVVVSMIGINDGKDEPSFDPKTSDTKKKSWLENLRVLKLAEFLVELPKYNRGTKKSIENKAAPVSSFA